MEAPCCEVSPVTAAKLVELLAISMERMTENQLTTRSSVLDRARKERNLTKLAEERAYVVSTKLTLERCVGNSTST